MTTTSITVSELIDQIKQLLEGEFREVVVEGEISNLSPSTAGHWYFTLSDAQSSLSTVVFKMDAFRNPLVRKLKNGDSVLCSGPIGVYTKRGSFQLIAKSIVAVGTGNLMLQFEALKKKLSTEGLFDLSIKKRIPSFPKKIGVITALNGAALQDFINVFKRRCLWMDIVVIPAIVQGKDSPASLIKAIRMATSFNQIDVLVLTRGGGSLEDLWAFNDEGLAREIFLCKIPVISAVGHQVDFTIADFVADLRVETPSAAAELLSAPQIRIQERLQLSASRLSTLSQLNFSKFQIRLNQCRPDILLERLWKKFFSYSEKINQKNPINRIYELTRLHEKHFRLDDCLSSMSHSMDKVINAKKSLSDNFFNLIKALDPSAVLKRGFCFLRNEEGKIITKYEYFERLNNEELFSIEFSDGHGRAKKM